MIEQLLRYSSINPAEASIVLDFIDFLRTPNEHPFHRSSLTRHITGSAWLISPRGDEVLLTHHKKLNRWLQLGGHCDGNSDVLKEATREAEEESGIMNIEPVTPDIFDLDKHLIPERADEPEHFHYDIRFLLRAPTKLCTSSLESYDLKWFASNDPFFESSNGVSLQRIYTKWLSYLETSAV